MTVVSPLYLLLFIVRFVVNSIGLITQLTEVFSRMRVFRAISSQAIRLVPRCNCRAGQRSRARVPPTKVGAWAADHACGDPNGLVFFLQTLTVRFGSVAVILPQTRRLAASGQERSFNRIQPARSLSCRELAKDPSDGRHRSSRPPGVLREHSLSQQAHSHRTP